MTSSNMNNMSNMSNMNNKNSDNIDIIKDKIMIPVDPLAITNREIFGTPSTFSSPDLNEKKLTSNISASIIQFIKALSYDGFILSGSAVADIISNVPIKG